MENIITIIRGVAHALHALVKESVQMVRSPIIVLRVPSASMAQGCLLFQGSQKFDQTGRLKAAGRTVNAGEQISSSNPSIIFVRSCLAKRKMVIDISALFNMVIYSSFQWILMKLIRLAAFLDLLVTFRLCELSFRKILCSLVTGSHEYLKF